MTKKPSKMKFLDQEKLRVLSDNLLEDIENVFDHFNIKYHKTDKKYCGGCPVHGGSDDKTPWNLFYDGDIYKGNWVCRSHHCEQVFKKSLIGFIRGLLSKERYGWAQKGDKEVSFDETVQWILAWTKNDFSTIKIDKSLAEKNRFVAQAKAWAKKEKNELNIDPSVITNNTTFPSAYFLQRGYSKAVLEKYCVGDCLTHGREMYNRAVVPIFNMDATRIIGVTGRSLFDRCDQCKLWHNPLNDCPNTTLDRYLSVKWRHNKGFEAEEYLYNLWFAKEQIKKNHSIILTESPGNVWRLVEAGIMNSVATFGAHLTDAQLALLQSTEALVLNLLYDNDEAGQLAMENIKKQTDRIYNIKMIKFDKYNDIGDMPVEYIKEHIQPQIVNYNF
jgi:hypothetical protein